MKKFVITNKSGMEKNVDVNVKECDVGFSWNVVNCRCEFSRKLFEFKKATALITTKQCDIETDDIAENITILENSIIKEVEDCKPFFSSSILLVCVLVITTGIMICFCLKS